MLARSQRGSLAVPLVDVVGHRHVRFRLALALPDASGDPSAMVVALAVVLCFQDQGLCHVVETVTSSC